MLCVNKFKFDRIKMLCFNCPMVCIGIKILTYVK